MQIREELLGPNALLGSSLEGWAGEVENWRLTEEFRGTCQAGERHHEAKLRDADIPAICAAHDAGESQASIGRRYGVSRWTIGLIVRGRKWRCAAADPAGIAAGAR